MRKQIIVFILSLYLLLMVIFSGWGNHLIVAYDISGSMYRLKDRRLPSGYKYFMKEEDFDRLTKYLVRLIFVGPPENILPNDARISGKLDPKPLYTPSDKLSLFTFHSSHQEILKMQPGVSKTHFEEQLPDLWGKNPFIGLESFVYRAEIHIYELAEQFYKSNSSKEITYWIMVSDSDEDTSTTYEKNPDELKKLAKLKEKYNTESMYYLLVNRHVDIYVYRMVPKGTPRPLTPVDIGPKIGGDPPFKNFFIVSNKSPNQPLGEVEFSKVGKWLKSIPLMVKSRDSVPESFQPQDVTMLAVGPGGENVKRRHPLQPQRTLPQGFQIKLPADSKELRNGKICPQFLLGYHYDGQDHTVPINQQLKFSTPHSNPLPAILGILLGVLVLAAGGLGGYALMKGSKKSKDVSFVIETADEVFSNRKNFTLLDGQTLGLGDDKVNYDYTFDVGCSDSFLHNENGTLVLQTPTTPQKLSESDKFSVVNQGGDAVELQISPTTVSQTSETELFSSTSSSTSAREDDPLSRI